MGEQEVKKWMEEMYQRGAEEDVVEEEKPDASSSASFHDDVSNAWEPAAWKKYLKTTISNEWKTMASAEKVDLEVKAVSQFRRDQWAHAREPRKRGRKNEGIVS